MVGEQGESDKVSAHCAFFAMPRKRGGGGGSEWVCGWGKGADGGRSCQIGVTEIIEIRETRGQQARNMHRINDPLPKNEKNSELAQALLKYSKRDEGERGYRH